MEQQKIFQRPANVILEGLNSTNTKVVKLALEREVEALMYFDRPELPLSALFVNPEGYARHYWNVLEKFAAGVVYSDDPQVWRRAYQIILAESKTAAAQNTSFAVYCCELLDGAAQFYDDQKVCYDWLDLCKNLPFCGDDFPIIVSLFELATNYQIDVWEVLSFRLEQSKQFPADFPVLMRGDKSWNSLYIDNPELTYRYFELVFNCAELSNPELLLQFALKTFSGQGKSTEEELLSRLVVEVLPRLPSYWCQEQHYQLRRMISDSISMFAGLTTSDQYTLTCIEALIKNNKDSDNSSLVCSFDHLLIKTARDPNLIVKAFELYKSFYGYLSTCPYIALYTFSGYAIRDKKVDFLDQCLEFYLQNPIPKSNDNVFGKIMDRLLSYDCEKYTPWSIAMFKLRLQNSGKNCVFGLLEFFNNHIDLYPQFFPIIQDMIEATEGRNGWYLFLNSLQLPTNAIKLYKKVIDDADYREWLKQQDLNEAKSKEATANLLSALS